jgi:hypothetical protein
VDLQQRIIEGEGEFLLFALTPPRQTATAEKAQEIADITANRLKAVGVDGLTSTTSTTRATATRRPGGTPLPVPADQC